MTTNGGSLYSSREGILVASTTSRLWGHLTEADKAASTPVVAEFRPDTFDYTPPPTLRKRIPMDKAQFVTTIARMYPLREAKVYIGNGISMSTSVEPVDEEVKHETPTAPNPLEMSYQNFVRNLIDSSDTPKLIRIDFDHGTFTWEPATDVHLLRPSVAHALHKAFGRANPTISVGSENMNRPELQAIVRALSTQSIPRHLNEILEFIEAGVPLPDGPLFQSGFGAEKPLSLLGPEGVTQ